MTFKLSGLILLVFLITGGIESEPEDSGTEKYFPCIYYEYNTIDPATEYGLNHFFNRIDRYLQKKQGKINIVHIGDSHIQADYLTHSARKRFQHTFGNGGRGFIFPHRLAKVNNAYSVGIAGQGIWTNHKSITTSDQGLYGITGISLKTYDSSAMIYMNPNKLRDMNYEFSKMKIFYEQSEFGFGMDFMENFPGDTDYDEIPLSQGISQIFFDQPKDSLWMVLDKSGEFQKEFQLYGMSLENNYPGLIYHGIGLNGAYAKSYLRNQYFESQLKSLQPDLVILSLGTNDGYMSESKFCIQCFKDSYRQLLSRIRSASPQASILITTPGDNFIKAKVHNPNMKKITEAMYEIAGEYDAALWDFNRVMGGSYSMRKWYSYGLAQRDLVHFTEEGYNQIGYLLFESIMKSYECRFDR